MGDTIRVGDMVEWPTMSGDVERGHVVDSSGNSIRVEYGPWGDSFWAHADRFRLVRRALREG
jgi:hypothetical protein